MGEPARLVFISQDHTFYLNPIQTIKKTKTLSHRYIDAEGCQVTIDDKTYLNKPKYVVQLPTRKWWRGPLSSSPVAGSRVLDAPFRVPSRVIAVQHPGGDARQSQPEDNQCAEQLQHPPVVAREGGDSCRRLSRTENS